MRCEVLGHEDMRVHAEHTTRFIRNRDVDTCCHPDVSDRRGTVALMQIEA